jgi:hypothetical protein
MPKVDGAYCHVTTDRRGRIATVISSTGQPYTCPESRSLLGVFAGYPDSVLAGEGTWHTEASVRDCKARGHAVVHLFDALRIAGRYIADRPFGERRDRLHEMVADLEQHVGRDRPWTDDAGGRSHGAGGRFCQRVPRSWRRLPLVPMVAARRLDELWEPVADGEREGLVLANLRAPVGRRRAKLKLKPAHTIDATVVDLDDRWAGVVWAGRRCAVSRRRFPELDVGQVVELRHNGWTERHSLLKQPRIVRVRHDLS